METRANSLIVGIFALVAIAALAVFTWWQASGTRGETKEVLFIFPGSVAGLSTGSPVFFNGIKYGDVTGISLNATDLRLVDVQARLSEDTPLKTDTRAILEFQAISGYASIGLSGGSFTAPDLFAGEGPYVIRGQQSTLTQLLSDGESIAERASSILDQVDTLLAVNAREVNTTVSNAAVISRNLANASEDVADVLSAAGEVATSFRELSGQVGTLAGQVEDTVGQIDVAEINAAIANVSAVTGTLAASDGQITQLLTNAESASAQLTALLTQAGDFASEARQAVGATRSIIASVEPERVTSILANIDAATGLVEENGADITRIARNAGEATERLNAILGDASGVGARVSEIATAVDPEAVGAAVENVGTLTATLADSAEGVSRTIASVETAAGRAAAALEGTEGIGAQVGAIVAGVDPIKIDRTLTAARDIAASAQATINAVDPEALGAAVGNVRTLTETLAGSAESVSRTIASAETATARVASALEGTEGIGGRVDALIASVDPVKIDETLTAARDAAQTAQATVANVDPEALGAAVGNVRTLTETLAGSAESVSRTIASAETASARIASALEGTEGIGGRVDALVASVDPVKIDETLTAARDAARTAQATVANVDPEALGAAVGNVRTLTETLAGSAESVSRTIASAETATARVASALEGTEGIGGRVDALVASVDPVKIDETLTAARDAARTAQATVANIDPEALGASVNNVRTLTETLAGSAESVSRTIASAETAIGRVSTALEGTEGLGTQVSAIVASVDPIKVDRTLTAARDIAASAQATVNAVDPAALGDAVNNVRTLTETLADSADGVSRTVTSVEAAASRAAAALEGTEGLGDRVSAIVASVDPVKVDETLTAVRDTAASAQATVAAVDPEALGAAVNNVRTLTETLAASADGVSRTVTSVEAAASRAAAALEGTEGLGDRVNAIVASVDPVKVDETLTAARDVVAGAQATVSNVDPEALGASVNNVRTLTETLAASADGVSRTVASVESAADRAARALEGTETLGADIDALVAGASRTADRIDAVVAGVAPETVTRVTEGVASASESVTRILDEAQGLPASLDATLLTARGVIRDARGVIEAVDPEQVRTAVADVGTLANTLSARAPDIDATVQNLRTASERANAVLGDASEFSASFESVSQSAEQLVARIDGLLVDIEPEALSDTVNNVRDVTATLAENRGDIGQTLRDVSGLAARLQDSAVRVDGLLVSLQDLVDDDAQALVANASAAADSLRTLSTELSARIPNIASNLDQFTGRGLEGLSALIEQGQRTVGSLDRVIGTVESNPQQFLFGRDGSSDYQPRGRQ